MDLEEKVINEKPIFHGDIMDVVKQTVKVPGEAKPAPREIVFHADAVAMLALTEDNKMLLEKQWRAPAKKVEMEIPAGKLDSRDNDDPLHAVKRELNEEVRATAGNIKKLYSFYTSPGFTDEFMYLYLVSDLKPVEHKLARDPGENLEIGAYTLEEAKKMVSDGVIDDGKTIMAIQYFELMQDRSN